MAVALSHAASAADVAAGDARAREEADLAAAKRLSLQPNQASSAAEALSFRLWDTEWCAAALS